MFLSHMDKDHPKIKVGDQSTFIQVTIDPCEELKFFHQFKRMSKLSEKAFMFSSAHRQGLSIRLGQRTIRSQVSVIFILLLSQKKNEDRQWQTDGKKLPVQKANKTSQIRMTTWKRKQNTSHSNSERSELRKRGGVEGKGVEGEKNPSSCLLSG